MSFTSRHAPRFILGLMVGALAVGPASASELKVTPGVPAGDELPKPSKYTGSHGLRVHLHTNTNPAFVQDNSPSTEARYRARGYFNDNGLKMGASDAFDLFVGYDDDGGDDAGGTAVLRIEIRQTGAGRHLNVCAVDDASATECLLDTADTALLGPGWNSIEIDYSTDADDGNTGDNDGFVDVWLNGKLVVADAGTLEGLNNEGRGIDYVQWGAVAGIDATMLDTNTTIDLTAADSTFRLDNFASQRSGYVGPITNAFTDVPVDPTFWGGVMGIYGAEITSGASCAPAVAPSYCPTNPTRRDQMAIFLLRGMDGGLFAPPACVPAQFNDIDCTNATFHPWITELADRGITTGASCAGTCPVGPCYCPSANVSRRQMAIFLLRSIEGSAYVPPSCVGSLPAFNDVPCTGTPADETFTNWIYELRDRNITTGASCAGTCAVGPCYCPLADVQRRQMALFLQRSFGLPLWEVGP